MTREIPRHLYPSDILMIGPWASALSVFVTKDDVLAQYRKDTGNTFTPANTPLEKLIQDETGQEFDFVISFITWFNQNVWGDLNLKAGTKNEEI